MDANVTGNEQTSIEMRDVAGLSQGRIVFRRFVRNRPAMIALVVLVLTAILAYSSVGIDALGLRIPGWWKWGWNSPLPPVNGGEPTMTLWPFSLGEHPFGQDPVGRDNFANVMRGTQQSLMVIVVIGVVSTAIGVVLGAIAGYYRRFIDSLIMRLTDVVLIIPVLVIGAVVGSMSQNSGVKLGSFGLALFLALVTWPSLARFVRAEFLSLREREFVDAARMAGAGDTRIIFRHILPNAVGVIIVNATLLMAAAILLETALDYLGFGVRAPDTSLGLLISNYQESFSTSPWLFWWPGVFIIIIALSINFIGDGLRDAFDPRQKRKIGRRAKAQKKALIPVAVREP
ncbi:ABC transporter permease [Microbacterium sp. STN6]|nr:ABC transporter permease [Microbacterium sp. STN6]